MDAKIHEFVADFSWDKAESKTRRLAETAFTDSIAAILAGVSLEQVRRTTTALGIDLNQKGDPDSPTVLGFGHRNVTLWEAVLLNGVLAHSCEYNDLFYKRPGHPSAVLVPAALGLGEKLHKSGRQVLEAYLCGLEVAGRINESLMPEHHKKGFHSTSTVGIVGAAMTAGKLLGLPKEKLLYALDLACTFACGLRGNLGYTANSLHVGNAAAGGVKAALYAKAGIQAREDLMTMPGGYICAFEGEAERFQQQMDLLGKVSVFEVPGLLLKKYPVCFSAYQAIEAAMWIKGQYEFTPYDVEEVICETSPHHYLSLPMEWPDNLYGQRFCVPFCVCWILSGHMVNVKELGAVHFSESEMTYLRERFCYRIDPLQAESQSVGSTCIRIRLKNGTIRERREFPKEEDRIENWTLDRLKEKVLLCTRDVLGEAGSEEFWEDIRHFAETEDVAEWLDEKINRRIVR